MCDAENFCLDSLDGSWSGIVFEAALFVYAFVGIAVVADAHLAVSLETLCSRWQLSEDVAGASFMALGSAAPEIAIAAISTFKSTLNARGKKAHMTLASSLGISSIIGSGMMAFTLIPGLCALAVGSPMLLTRRPLARDAGAYVASLLGLRYAIADGVVDTGEAALLLGGYAVYLGVVVASPAVRRALRKARGSALELGTADKTAALLDAKRGGLAEVLEEGAEPEPPPPTGVLGAAHAFAGAVFWPLLSAIRATCPECEAEGATAHLYPITLLASFCWLAVLSAVLSAVVTRWGELLAVPAATMGMYVVAVGAQIPDTVQAVAVARRGHGSMAVASATGSQVMNILVGLGMPWLVTGAAGQRVVVPEHAQLSHMAMFQLGCVAVYAGVLLLPAVPTWGGRGRAELGRGKGLALLGTYVAVCTAYRLWGQLPPPRAAPLGPTGKHVLESARARAPPPPGWGFPSGWPISLTS